MPRLRRPGRRQRLLLLGASTAGVAQLIEFLGEGTSGIIQRTDAKLYESKSGGRNRVAA